MIGDRIKRLLARISAAKGPEGGTYIVYYVDGLLVCKGHAMTNDMTFQNQAELSKWAKTLPGENVFIHYDI